VKAKSYSVTYDQFYISFGVWRNDPLYGTSSTLSSFQWCIS